MGSGNGVVSKSKTQEILPTRTCSLWGRQKPLGVDPSVCSQERGLDIRKEHEELHPHLVTQDCLGLTSSFHWSEPRTTVALSTQELPADPPPQWAHKDITQDVSSLHQWGVLCSKDYKRCFQSWLRHTHLVTSANFLSYFLGSSFVKKDNSFCSA